MSPFVLSFLYLVGPCDLTFLLNSSGFVKRLSTAPSHLILRLLTRKQIGLFTIKSNFSFTEEFPSTLLFYSKTAITS